SSPLCASRIDVLRFVVDKALEMGGQPVTPYTDPSLPGVIIKASHVTELRTRMNQARTALGYTALSFTDPSLAGVPVKVIHWMEVWDGLRWARKLRRAIDSGCRSRASRYCRSSCTYRVARRRH